MACQAQGHFANDGGAVDVPAAGLGAAWLAYEAAKEVWRQFAPEAWGAWPLDRYVGKELFPETYLTYLVIWGRRLDSLLYMCVYMVNGFSFAGHYFCLQIFKTDIILFLVSSTGSPAAA